MLHTPLSTIYFFISHHRLLVQTRQALQVLLTARAVQRESQPRITSGAGRDTKLSETHQLHTRCAAHGDTIVDGLEQRKRADVVVGGNEHDMRRQRTDGLVDHHPLRILLRDALVFFFQTLAGWSLMSQFRAGLAQAARTVSTNHSPASSNRSSP